MDIIYKKVCAGVVPRANPSSQVPEVLIGLRKEGDSLAGYWEFPGGSVEEGEAFEACVVREFQEELEMKIQVVRFLHCERVPTPKGIIELHFFLCRALTLPAVSVVHEQIAWVSIDGLSAYKMAPGDLPLVSLLPALLR